MPKKIYGNDYILSALDKAFRLGKMPHAILIYGEKGLGKKTLAEYICARLLCSEDNSPCGKCKNCIMNVSSFHPDKIYVEKSGVRGGFSVSEVRRICSDALVKPNNSEVKIYIFSDADNITIQAQNALLKILEEPPPHCYFIFTASGRDIFLKTIISRVTSIAMADCTYDETLTALVERGADSDLAKKAYGSYGGNIGICLDYISGGEAKKNSDIADELCNAIIKRDEYLFLKIASSFGGNLAETKALLELMDIRFCDCAAVRCGAKPYSKSASGLSDIISKSSALKLHEDIAQAVEKLDGNVSAKLVLSFLCGRIFGCLQGL